MSTIRSQKKYTLLGKLVELHHPEIAQTLLSESSPVETDLSKVENYYRLFCDQNEIGYKELSTEYDHSIVRKLNRTERGNLKRVFIGAMIHLYSPASYKHPKGAVIFTKGLQSTLRKVIGLDHRVMNLLFDQVVAMKRVFEDKVVL